MELLKYCASYEIWGVAGVKRGSEQHNFSAYSRDEAHEIAFERAGEIWLKYMDKKDETYSVHTNVAFKLVELAKGA